MFDSMKRAFGSIIGTMLGFIVIGEIVNRLGYNFKNETEDFEEGTE